MRIDRTGERVNTTYLPTLAKWDYSWSRDKGVQTWAEILNGKGISLIGKSIMCKLARGYC